jgi:hypothetical protein
LRANHTAQTFTNPDDLATKVTTDLYRWLFKHYLTPRLEQAAQGEMSRPEAEKLLGQIKDWDSVLPNLRNKLRSAGFAPGSRVGNVVANEINSSNIATGDYNQNFSGPLTVTGDGIVIGHHSSATVIKTTTQQGLTQQDFAALLSQVRELLGQSGLSTDDREMAEADLKKVEKEAVKEKPRLTLIESWLKSVETMVKSTEGIGSTAVKLLPALSQAAHFARQLFP